MSAAANLAPVLSVIIPTYRREAQLEAAIASVRRQSVGPLELIVIDDSPERSARSVVSAIDDERIRYVPMPEPSRGRPALVRNHGIKLASGRYLYFLDDDDLVADHGLEHVIKAFESHPSKGVVYGCVESFGPDADTTSRYQDYFDWAAATSRRVRRSSWITVGVIMFRGTLIINSCCAIRRDAALVLGGYDPELDVYEDVDFFTRGIRAFGHVFIDAPVLRYSTGLPSIIHALDGESQTIHLSNTRALTNFRRRHGTVEYRALQVASKLLPIGGPPNQDRSRPRAVTS